MNRRFFLQTTLACSASLPVLKTYASGHNPFVHGVASGDPLADRVILWTRISPSADISFAKALVGYRWEIALDPQMGAIVNRGEGITGPARDYTVKIDADGLQPGTTYYYRFYSGGIDSPIGRTRTLPQGHVENLRIAFCSCSHYGMGYFNVYREIAQRADLDVVLHLGDYIYEYGPDGYGGDTGIGRDPLPAKEILSLADYRQRYAQYRTDPDLQEVHRQHPFICIWDDHETANNAWSTGAENHDASTEGDWFERRQHGAQAYFEWLPIRETGIVDGFGYRTIYRAFRFGDLLDLFMLDTRLAGRDEPATYLDFFTINDENRSLLGFEQEDWLYQNLTQSQADGVRWRALGQQVMLAQLSLATDLGINIDQWDGYNAARKRLFHHVAHQGIDNLMVLTGDIHSSWAFDLAADPFNPFTYNRFSGRGALGGEYITPAVTSRFADKSFLTDVAAIALDGTLPHLKWADITQRGYVLLDLNHQRSKAHWYHVDTVTRRDYTAYLARIYQQKAGANHIRRSFFEATGTDDSAALAPDYASLDHFWLGRRFFS